MRSKERAPARTSPRVRALSRDSPGAGARALSRPTQAVARRKLGDPLGGRLLGLPTDFRPGPPEAAAHGRAANSPARARVPGRCCASRTRAPTRAVLGRTSPLHRLVFGSRDPPALVFLQTGYPLSGRPDTAGPRRLPAGGAGASRCLRQRPRPALADLGTAPACASWEHISSPRFSRGAQSGHEPTGP